MSNYINNLKIADELDCDEDLCIELEDGSAAFLTKKDAKELILILMDKFDLELTMKPVLK